MIQHTCSDSHFIRILSHSLQDQKKSVIIELFGEIAIRSYT